MIRIQKEINRIIIDLGVLCSNILLHNADMNKNYINDDEYNYTAISAALANTGQTTTGAAIQASSTAAAVTNFPTIVDAYVDLTIETTLTKDQVNEIHRIQAIISNFGTTMNDISTFIGVTNNVATCNDVISNTVWKHDDSPSTNNDDNTSNQEDNKCNSDGEDNTNNEGSLINASISANSIVSFVPEGGP